jgi:hypothetical protein
LEQKLAEAEYDQARQMALSMAITTGSASDTDDAVLERAGKYLAFLSPVTSQED